MENVREALMNAEIAFSNNQLDEALDWYQKVLVETPDDIYVLSRAGAICVPLGKFKDALEYFGRAKDIDPENGDNYFNYANACFFNRDYATAFYMYVEAERHGCSEDVTPRLYYQMALLCSMRQDIQSSLAYFKKCEDSDKDGVIALNPDLISEKLKLFMVQQDYENAEKCAAQLVAIQPTVFRSYMVYYSILMAHKQFSAAEKLLADADRYAELTDEDKYTLVMQKAALLMAKGEVNGTENYEKAVNLLKEYNESADLTEEQKQQINISISEAYLKLESYDDAIICLNSLLSPNTTAEMCSAVESDENTELSDYEIEEMLQEDIFQIQEKIDQGAIDDNLGMYADIEYDEDGNERHVYDDLMFASGDSDKDSPENESEEQSASNFSEPSIALKEKIYFNLLSAFLGKEDFCNAAKFANILKHSSNKYYSYYGLYVSVLAERKMNGSTSNVEQKYAEAIAFFRSKTFADPKDTLASVFRARLYIEQGKYEKAREIACLLSEGDRQAILDYEKSYSNN